MPAGRKQVDYTGIRYDALTYKIDNSTITYDVTKVNNIGKAAGTGDAVMLSADDTVALTSDGAAVEGKLLGVTADGFCTVQAYGFATLPGGDAAAFTRGRKIVGAVGAAAARGYIREAAIAGAAYAQVAANEGERARGRIVNTAVATAIVVDLG